MGEGKNWGVALTCHQNHWGGNYDKEADKYHENNRKDINH